MDIREIDIVEKKAKEFLNSLFLKSFEELFNRHKDFINTLADNIKSEPSRIKELKDIEQIFKFYLLQNKFRLELHNTYYKFLKSFTTESTINQIHDLIIDQTRDYSVNLTWDQDDSNFKTDNTSNVYLKLLIPIKHAAFKTSRLFTGIFKGKEYKDNYKWKRRVPFKETINYFYANRLLDNIESSATEIIQKTGNDLIEINEKLINHTDSLIACCLNSDDNNEVSINDYTHFLNNLDGSVMDLRKLVDHLEETIDIEIARTKIEIIEAFKIIGTVFLPYDSYSGKRNDKINIAVKNKYKLLDERKKLYFKGIFSKSEFVFNVNEFQISIIINLFPVVSKFKIDLNSRLEKVLRSFNSEIDNTIKDLKNCSSSKQELSALLVDKKNLLRDKIDGGLIIEFVDILKEANYGNALFDYMESIKTSVDVFSKDYLFIKHDDLKYGINEKDLHKFAPKFIITSLFLLSYYSFIKKQIEEIASLYNSFNTQIINLGRVTEYNINSAIAMLDKEEIEVCLATAEEGLIRVKNRKHDVYNTLMASVEDHIKGLKKVTQDLLDKTNELKNTEKIINLKILATKEKTISDLKNIFNNLFNKSKKQVISLYSKFSIVLNSTLKKYSKLKTKVGLADKENEISESISEYLSDTVSSLEKIPPVYKNLFSNTQINDELIFVGRSSELDKFEKSYKKWSEGKLSSLVIVGEKGSGTSSLFNIASNIFDKDIILCRREFSKTISSESVFIEEISKLFKFSGINSVKEIIENINSSDERYVVFVENLEDFYLKTINGFVPIHLLVDIMTATHNKIFWISSCAKYSWNYLVKVVNIQDYFVFKIELNELTEKELEEIIYKRHNISGYKLVFLPTIEEESSKVYKKLNEKDRVVYLKEKYFETITKLTQGNIALSLFLWLRSIEKIDNDTIYVSTSIDIDFSFLNNMSDVKIFSIAILIIHDGLSIEEHSQILNLSTAKSKLIFDSLTEDGIIFKRNEKFKINFQLYRPLVNLLKNRNIFH